ncbi:efflux RND transporter periplasmic adaptor subunit [Szabonella alba]|uniref:Efflux RND transporter periplasmic adaptor subunit n=1 Tax=Szabonella alba TaxID=2804194 RepID=A0A8K0XZV7_9RHOB|nr:efflux RND transporter periplasmic adaptor subunit [Szabonella alba]MBL4917535.1 efflux RND transporter periplasmic adaptor subunit [Szabonella alba]
MRVVPFLTALAVTGSLYLLIFERERLWSFASGGATPAAQAAEPAVESGTPEQRSDASAPRPVSVLVQASRAQNVDAAILVRGRTEAARQVEARAETSGLVISEPLRRGAYVRAGQTLCQLDPGTRPAMLLEAEAREMEAQSRIPESDARLEEARAKLQEAEINDRAAAQLSAGGFASETRVAGAQAALSSARAGVSAAEAGLQTAQSGILAAEAAVESARRELDRLTISAPFDGLLESDTAELGALLQPGAICGTVIQLDPVKLVGFLSETDVDKVDVGALAGARLVSGTEAMGRVTFLSRAADPLTRTFRVEVTVANSDLAIRDGQTAEIRIETEGRSGHLLPGSALTLDDDGQLGIRVVDAERRAAFLPVTLLRDTVDGVWLTGLPDAVDVIVVGQEFVAEGTPLAPTWRDATE